MHEPCRVLPARAVTLDEPQAPEDAEFQVGVPTGVGLQPERRLLGQVVQEEEEKALQYRTRRDKLDERLKRIEEALKQ